MNDQRSYAIVLKVSAHGESDKILSLYSRDLGKISVIAKGAKRSQKRFVNKLELFTCLRIFCRPPKRGDLYFLSEAELINAHLTLRTTYPRYVTATFINELIQLFCGEQDPDPTLFTLLSWALHTLNQGMSPAKTALFFHFRLLDLCGYQPQIDQCRSCGRTIEQSTGFTLHPGSGTLLCRHCRPPSTTSSFTLTVQTLKFLHSAQQMELEQLNRLQLPLATIYQTLGVLYHYSRHLLQQDIHSWKQLLLLKS